MGKQTTGKKLSWRQKLEVIYSSVQDDEKWNTDPISCIHKLIRLLEDLKKAQGTSHQPVINEAEAAERLRQFENWLLEGGAKGPGSAWTLAQVPRKGTGIIASQAYEAGEEVTAIPRSIMFTTSNNKTLVAALAPLLRESLIKSTPTLELAVLLAHHMVVGDSSSFHPYIQVLPTEFDTPLYWKAHTFDTLDQRGLHSVLDRAVGSVRAAVVQYYHVWQALKRLDNAGALTPQNYSWDLHRKALCSIVTRQNATPDMTGEKTVLALIPGWDMANHEFGDLTTFFDMEQDCLSLNAMRAFQPGEEVTMCYGRRSNEELLLYSGFCAPSNPYDSTKLQVRLVEDEIFKIRQMLWTRHSGSQSLSGSIVEVTLTPFPTEPSETAILAAMCATVSKQDASTMLRLSQGGVMDILSQLSEGASTVALQYLRDAISETSLKLNAVAAASESKSDTSVASDTISDQERLLNSHIDVIVHSTAQIFQQHIAAVDRLLESFA